MYEILLISIFDGLEIGYWHVYLRLVSTVVSVVIRTEEKKPFPIEGHIPEWNQLPTSEPIASRRLSLEEIHQKPLFPRDQPFTGSWTPTDRMKLRWNHVEALGS